MKLALYKETIEKIVSEIEKFIVGKRELIEILLISLLSEGHILVEGPPGTAKTLLTKTFAQTIGAKFARIQMTPDTLPADIIGTMIYDMKNNEFKLKKGPIFTNILLIDELNRAPPKTQAAFLEAMQERQVTIEGVSYPLERPFLVLATQIPYGSQGTYPLTEVQIDRFAYKVKSSYPSPEEEIKVLERVDFIELTQVKQVVEREEILGLIEETRKVYVSDSIRSYIVDIITNLRKNSNLIEGPSTRASIWMLKAARAYALINGRDFVIPDDIKAVAPYVLRHRIQLKREIIEELNEEQIIEETLSSVPVPKK